MSITPQASKRALHNHQHEALGDWLKQMQAAADFLQGDEHSVVLEQLMDHYESHVRPHFRFEEQRLFPALRRVVGNTAVDSKLRALEAEHMQLETRLDTMLDDLYAMSTGELDAYERDQAARRIRLVIDRMLLHAAQEDDILGPLLERHYDALWRELGEAPLH
jgi:iron-sulfur cluster repair protein YtfE (RIC family)